MIKKGSNVILKFSTYDGELSRYKGKAYIYESMENATKYCYHNEELVEYTPVKRGHWIWKDFGDHAGFLTLCCSECLESEGARENANYCPHCGSKMT